MATRTRPSEDRTQERNREDRERERERDASRTRDVRVGKIQYRFLKELEEKPVHPGHTQGALDMAEKIRRYPLEGAHVMGSWERFTKKAIDDYKAGRGSNAERDADHAAYAVLFTAVRNGAAPKDQAELVGRIRDVARKNDELRAAERTRGNGRESPRVDEPKRAAQQRDGADATAKEVPSPKVPAQQARQRTLALPEQAPREQKLDLVREGLEMRVDKLLGKLREVPPELRTTIEGTAIDMLVDRFHTQKSARADLPDAVEALRRERTAGNTVNALTLAVISRVPEQGALLAEVRRKNAEEQREILAEARDRLERYPPLESGVSLVQRDQIAAAVRDVVEPSMESRKEALVLARAREEIEGVADPKRFSWDRFAADMISEPG